jgi:hypothetical protein
VKWCDSRAVFVKQLKQYFIVIEENKPLKTLSLWDITTKLFSQNKMLKKLILSNRFQISIQNKNTL